MPLATAEKLSRKTTPKAQSHGHAKTSFPVNTCVVHVYVCVVCMCV